MAHLLQEIFSVTNKLQSLLLEFAMHQPLVQEEPKQVDTEIQQPAHAAQELVQVKPVIEPQHEVVIMLEEEKSVDRPQTKKQIKKQKTDKMVNKIIVPEPLAQQQEQVEVVEVQQMSVKATQELEKLVTVPEAKEKGYFKCPHCTKPYIYQKGFDKHMKMHQNH